MDFIETLSILELMYKKASITKEIALIELFGGIGAQKKALEKLFTLKDHLLVEIDINATISHAAIHHNLRGVMKKEITQEKQYYLNELKKFNWWINEKPADISRMNIDKLKQLYHARILTNNLVDIINVDITQLDEFMSINKKQGRSIVLSWSTPCQDFSKAGLQKGFAGNKGNMTVVTHDLIHKLQIKPDILFFENVPNILQDKFRSGFQKVLSSLEVCGYYHHIMQLNAKNYNVPQNRERVFVVSTLGETYLSVPKEIKRTKKLIDILEEDVPQNKYLTSEELEKLLDTKNKNIFVESNRFYPSKEREIDCINSKVRGRQPSFQNRIFNSNKLAPTITASFMYNITIPIKSATKCGYELAECFDGIDIAFPNSNTRRGRVQKQMSQTLTTQNSLGVLIQNGEYFYVRKYTPLEAFRLMTFDDEDYEKTKHFMSESSLYKQTGNSIVIDVIYAIFSTITII